MIMGILSAHRIGLAVLLIIALGSSVVCRLCTKRNIALIFPVMLIVGYCLTISGENGGHEKTLLDIAAAEREFLTVEGVVDSYLNNSDGRAYKIIPCGIKFENGTKITPNCGIRLITERKLNAGDKLRISSRIYSHNGKFNPSDSDTALYLKIRGYDYSIYFDDNDKFEMTVYGKENGIAVYIKNFAYGLREKLNNVYDRCFDETKAGILSSVITGSRDGLDNDIADVFRDAGIYHFLAISGLHLSAISAGLLFLFGRRKTGYFITAAFLMMYCIMVGMGVSVMRAVIMAYVFMFCKSLGRRYDLINSASLAALVLLVNNLVIAMIIFLFSMFGAVFGIALMQPFAQRSSRYGAWLSSLAISFGAASFTWIITLFGYYTVNIFAVFINMLMIVPLSLIVCAALIFGITGIFIGDMHLFAMPLDAALNVLIKISEILGGFSVIKTGCPTYTAACMILISALLFLLFVSRPRKKRAAALVLSAALTLAFSIYKTPNGVDINFVYVGQGDCCVINNGGSAYIIDCGGNALSDIGKDTGRYRIMPFLEHENIKTVKGVFISHTDTDHIKGLFDMIGKTDIENIYISEFTEKNNNYDILCDMADENGIPIKTFKVNDAVSDGEIMFRCLYPQKSVSSNNNNSMVLMFEHGSNRVLFTGDIDRTAEKKLIDGDIKADVLKLPHHGSKTSCSAEFLNAVGADIAVASAGKNNYYGLPSPETVERVEESGAELYITYDGMVSIKSDGKELTVDKYKPTALYR